MKIRSLARLVLIATVIASIPGPPAHAAIPCPPPDAALAGTPVQTRSDIPSPTRADADGFTTITVFIDDPVDENGPVMLAPAAEVPDVAALPTGSKVGAWYHNWKEAPHLTTVGLWLENRDRKVRLPIAVIENLGRSFDEIVGTLTARALTEALHHAFTTAPYLWNMLLVGPDGAAFIPMVGGLVYALGLIIASYFLTIYPPPIGWESYTPAYVWTLYKNGVGQQVWGGIAVRQSGAYEWSFDADPLKGSGGRGCKRTRIDAVTRTQSSVDAVGGVFIIEEAVGRCEGFCLSPSATPQKERFDARQRFTVGVSAGGVDVPFLVLEMTEHKEGNQPFLLYPDYQREELKLGITVAGEFIPLIGARFEAWHGVAPKRQTRLASIGVFDPLGAYHPAIGTRMQFERQTSDVWAFLLAFDGLGSQRTGDAMIDLGVFDPLENFVPVLGTRYDDDFAGHRFEYRGMISTGPYAGDRWEPVLAVTYDGERSSAVWAFANVGDQYGEMGEWIVAAGAFNPAIGYKPVLGLRFVRGQPTAEFPVVETYRVGVFPADYATFIPLAGANWSGKQTSGSWGVAYAGNPPASTMTIPSDARVDVGFETSVTGFRPVAGATLIPGSPQRYDAGVWTPLGYLPLVTACQTPGAPGTVIVGLAAGGGASRVPLAHAGLRGQAPVAGTGDCPK